MWRKSIKKNFDRWSECNTREAHLLSEKNPDNLYIDRMDFQITERCSLKCQECLSLMPYYKHPKDIPLEQMKKTLDILDNVFDKIWELRILGGNHL